MPLPNVYLTPAEVLAIKTANASANALLRHTDKQGRLYHLAVSLGKPVLDAAADVNRTAKRLKTSILMLCRLLAEEQNRQRRQGERRSAG